jgi:hypothetical protein
VHLALGHDDPVDPRVRALLRQLHRHGARSKEAEPMAALTVELLRKIYEHAQQDSPPEGVLRRRAYLVTAWWTRQPLFAGGFDKIRQVTARAVAEAGPAAEEILIEGAAVPLRRDQHPLEFACLLAAGEALASPDPVTAGTHYQAYRRASDMLGLAPVASSVPAALMQLSEEDRYWVLACLDPELHDRRRDLTYLTLGVACALRHHTQEGIDLADVTINAEGYEIVLRKLKWKSASRVVQVVHLGGETGCRQPCPACLLDELLSLTRRLFGATDGPLLAELHLARRAPMNRQSGWRVARRWWRAADCDPKARVGTRSARVGAATSAHRLGWSKARIAAELLFHTDPDLTELYIRRSAPLDRQFFLTL